MPTRGEIKSYFDAAGKRPQAGQFAALVDSIPMVDGSTGEIEYFNEQTQQFETKQFASCLCVQTAKLDIPSAEVLTLFSTPKPFGITVPTGYYVQPLSGQFKATYGGVTYATNIALEVGFGGAKPIFNGALNFNSNIFQNLEQEVSGTVIANADVQVSVNSGNPTAGDSDITIYLTYVLIPL